MRRMGLLHQVHKLEGLRANLVMESLGVVLRAICLFVWRQVRILCDELPLVVEYAMQGYLLALVRYAQ